MEISVVIPTYNQKERLRLVLCGLEQQTLSAEHFEILVIDDGSTDGTGQTLNGLNLPNLRLLVQTSNQGRNRTRNRGIAAAKGELVVFLDGDALPAADLLERYLEGYQQHGDRAVLCGFQRCLPDLEYFQDPQTGALVDRDLPSVLQDYIALHREEMVVSEKMIREDFSAIQKRTCEGGYPFPELKERQDQVLSMLSRCPTAAVRWLGFIPHNGAIARTLLQEERFDEKIGFSEGWELVYRLQNHRGASVFSVPAESVHLYHYHAFVEPEAAREEAGKRYRAIEHIAKKHEDSRIRLLFFWYARLWPDSFIPEELVVEDLTDLDRLYRELSDEEWREYQIVLDNHPVIPYFTEVDYENCS